VHGNAGVSLFFYLVHIEVSKGNCFMKIGVCEYVQVF